MSSENQIPYTPSDAVPFNLYMLEWRSGVWERWMQESGRWSYLGPLNEEAVPALLRYHKFQQHILSLADFLVTMGPEELRRLAARQSASTT